MYHIPNDKRSYHSAALICEGFAEKLREMPYEKINITNVCAPKGIARTTFYRLFDTLDDVLLYQFDSMFEESIRQYENANEPLPQIILRIAICNQALICAILHSGRNDLFDFSTRNKKGVIIQNLKLIICILLLPILFCIIFDT